jgi:nucleoside-diphosphate-sugar epimerase
MRVLILGGTGFIGAHITQRLLDVGHEVTVFHRGASLKGALGLCGDRNRLADSIDGFRRLSPDVVVDTIAFTQLQAQSLVNVFGGIAKRVVVLSSGDVYRANDILYGRVPGAVETTPLTESSPLRERLYPYRGTRIPGVHDFNLDEYDKILVERAVLNNRDLPATVLRLPMVYGPGGHESAKRRFFSYLKRMDDGRQKILLDQRTAASRAPWAYVGDVAEAVRLTVENERAAGQIYNVCEPDAQDMQSWIRELAVAAGWTGRLVVVDQPCPPPSLPRNLNLDQHLDMDTAKIRRELGYRETLSRGEALEKNVAWDREHPPIDVDRAQFDYAAEDAILEQQRRALDKASQYGTL